MPHKVKSFLRYFRVWMLWCSGLLWLRKRRAAQRGVTVITLHRVLDDGEFFCSSSLPGILLRAETFKRFVSWMEKHSTILDLSQSPPDWDARPSSPRIALTFDDGWLDNYTIAAPLLLQKQIPATIFTCPGLMGKSFPFWPEQVVDLLNRLPGRCKLSEIFPDLAFSPGVEVTELVVEHFKQLIPKLREQQITRLQDLVQELGTGAPRSEPHNKTMTWDQVKKLDQCGIRIGSHTMTHPILTSVPEEVMRTELYQSRQELEAQLGKTCVLLAYPNGNHNESTVDASAGAGYKLAFTTKRGVWTQQTHSLQIPRINISERKLTGPSGRFSRVMAEYSLFWKL